MTVLAKEIGQLLAAAQQARASGRIDQESALLERAGALAPDDPLVANARGVHALGRGAWNDARTFFEAAIKADSAEAALWMNLATAYRSARDDDGEQRSLEGALALDRRHVMAQYRMADLFHRSRAGRCQRRRRAP